jgi:hypothetical protein
MGDRRPIPALEELTGDLDDGGAFHTRAGAGATGAHLFGANALSVKGLGRYAAGVARRLRERLAHR